MANAVDVIYGNIGFSGGNIQILNGSKGGDGEYNFKPIYGTTGLYFIQFAQAFLYPPAVILTQIYHGGSELDQAQDPKGDTGPQWGNTRDNAVLVGISQKEFKLITGNDDGNHENRMFGFVAVGYEDPAATVGYVDPRSKAAAVQARM